ncbi:MAG: serine hydrolase [Flavobacteriales bacterium]|nr:serine hydrolase [Flavobacteriales bacterium]
MTARHLLLVFVVLLGTGCTVGRFFMYNFADTRDHKKFPSRPLPASRTPLPYSVAEVEKGPRTVTYSDKEQPFDIFLEERKTVAFLIIHRDTLKYSRYFKGYDQAQVHTSFSMAKSVMSMLIGSAIADGFISNVQQPVTDFVPELKKNGFDKVTLEHLLQMTSGLKFSESYVDPFGTAAKYYYGRTLYKNMAHMKLKREPGERFEYVSGNSQLLGLILERALRAKGDQRTITQYLSDRVWSPLGMEYDATWSIDRKQGGIEKTFCCINAPALDFAKLGSLYLHKGNWKGQRLIPQEWVERSTRVDTTNGSAARYQYQWWLPSAEGDFMAQGILGQYVYVDPARELVIVRLGKQVGGVSWARIFRSVAELYVPDTE